jgi:tRNA dimethylallyltransferase
LLIIDLQFVLDTYANIFTRSESLTDFSENFQIGIFQSIGFKEFDEYLNKYLDSSIVDENEKKRMFDSGVEKMKLNTRRYAKKQLRWVLNRFIKSNMVFD